MERPKYPECPHCGRPLEEIAVKFRKTWYMLTRDGDDTDEWMDDNPEWGAEEVGNACPHCFGEIEGRLAEEVFRLNRET